MSLLRFLAQPDVAAKIKPLRPKLSRKIPAVLKAEPRSNRYMMVGTAFDYLLRFELQRRAPHAVSERWVAEYAPDIIWKKDDKSTSFLHLRKDDKGVVSVGDGPNPEMYGGDEAVAEELAGRARRVVETARTAIAAYVTNTSPTPAEQADAARHAIRLGKLEEMYRAFRLDPTFEEAPQEDVEDLLGMLAIAPFESLIHDKVLLLNPSFGETARLVGGSDTDLITGDMLVDFKTTKLDSMQANNLDQLFGYLLLVRHQRQLESSFPEINRLALYFCRHGCLWTLNATTWTDHPAFPEVERWFFKQAKVRFGANPRLS